MYPREDLISGEGRVATGSAKQRSPQLYTSFAVSDAWMKTTHQDSEPIEGVMSSRPWREDVDCRAVVLADREAMAPS